MDRGSGVIQLGTDPGDGVGGTSAHLLMSMY